MSLPARSPYCLKCQSFTSLDQGRCEECHSYDVEMRTLPDPDVPTMEPPLEPKPEREEKPVPLDRGASLFKKMRDSIQ